MAEHGAGARVGVVTIIDYTNYGNRLQNYAVHEALAALGCEPVTLRNFPRAADAEKKSWVHVGREGRPTPTGFARISHKMRSDGVWGAASAAARKLGRRIAHAEHERAIETQMALSGRRAERFLAFSRAHVRETDFTLYLDTPTDHLDAMFDHFVVGSDQVWNPHFRGLGEIDFLTFAHPDKRVALAASFGISAMPDEFAQFYRERLAGFAHVSVREEAGAEIVRTLTGREATVTADPTMMLTPQAWGALARRHPRQPEGLYLLTYFLGQRPPAYRRLIEETAARHGLAVVELNDFEAPAFYAADPPEFLGLVRDAAIVFTDSFHGAVFSVLFETPLVSFPRVDIIASMDSRLDTLFGSLGLAHRRLREDLDAAGVSALMEPDYDRAGAIVAARRREAFAYLSAALPSARVPELAV